MSMSTRKRSENKRNINDDVHLCRECKHVVEVIRFNTLSVHDRKPTLGECPYWSESRCVLLSQQACKFFEK